MYSFSLQLKFHKSYHNEQEEQVRLQIYLEKKQFVEEHNQRFQKGEVSFKLGINQFSDMLAHEVTQKMNGFRKHQNGFRKALSR